MNANRRKRLHAEITGPETEDQDQEQPQGGQGHDIHSASGDSVSDAYDCGGDYAPRPPREGMAFDIVVPCRVSFQFEGVREGKDPELRLTEVVRSVLDGHVMRVSKAQAPLWDCVCKESRGYRGILEIGSFHVLLPMGIIRRMIASLGIHSVPNVEE